MSNYQQKPETGTLFKNDKRETDKHPLYRGSALIDGVAYWMSAWVNKIQGGDNAGQSYMALKFDKKDQQSGGSRTSDNTALEDDEVPF